MSKERPDHHDADFVLRVYEMRREAVLRESRSLLNAQFWPRSFDDVAAVAKMDHPLNAPYRQVSGYWEMVYGLARHGIVHADYLVENNAEGLLHFAKVAPYLEEIRKNFAPTSFRNAEWAGRECAEGRRALERFTAYVRKTLAARSGAAKG
jgi:hypothetical protein